MGQVVYKIHYDFNSERNCRKWALTQDQDLAIAADQSKQIASLEDLHDWVCATGQVFTGIIQVIDGLCKWQETSFIDELGMEDYSCGYILV